MLEVYLSPSQPLVDSDLSACLCGILSILMAGDLKAKHMDWNSRPTMTRGMLLHDYSKENFSFICIPDSTITVPYNSCATPEILDTVLTKDVVNPVYLMTCSTLRSDSVVIFTYSD
jgi:hypothetical protein